MRYFLGFLAAIGLIIVVIFLLVRAFTGGGGKPKEHQINLRDYAGTTTMMQYTQDGPVTADELHNGVRITVGQTETQIEVYQGYQNNVIRSNSYANNETSYAEFLSALQLLGYTNGDKDSDKADERGFCPSGSRYIFQIKDGGTDVQRFWSTSCGGGTFGGNSPKVRALFREQVPDYNKITRGLNL